MKTQKTQQEILTILTAIVGGHPRAKISSSADYAASRGWLTTWADDLGTRWCDLNHAGAERLKKLNNQKTRTK